MLNRPLNEGLSCHFRAFRRSKTIRRRFQKRSPRYIWGEEDEFIPLKQGEELAAALSANRLTRVPAAGHLIQEDAPEAVVAALLGD